MFEQNNTKELKNLSGKAKSLFYLLIVSGGFFISVFVLFFFQQKTTINQTIPIELLIPILIAASFIVLIVSIIKVFNLNRHIEFATGKIDEDNVKFYKSNYKILQQLETIDKTGHYVELKSIHEHKNPIVELINNINSKHIAYQNKANEANLLAAATIEQQKLEITSLIKKTEEYKTSIFNIQNETFKITKELHDFIDFAVSIDKKIHEFNSISISSSFGIDLFNNKNDGIRVAIQSASKKAKKLGESSQFITTSVLLIKNITKQINILALNAAIHAASSGDSAKEFSIVAQEVQRLGLESHDVIDKLENMISEIQSDTSNVILAIEKSTQEIISAFRLAEENVLTLSKMKEMAPVINEDMNKFINSIMGAKVKLNNLSKLLAY